MDATCSIQDSIHVFSLVHTYVSRILGTYQNLGGLLLCKTARRWVLPPPALARDFAVKKATPLTLPTRSSINARIFGTTVKRCCFAKYNFNYVLKFVLALINGVRKICVKNSHFVD